MLPLCGFYGVHQMAENPESRNKIESLYQHHFNTDEAPTVMNAAFVER